MFNPKAWGTIYRALLRALDLLKAAKRGRGENIYLIRFHYFRPRTKKIARRKPVET